MIRKLELEISRYQTANKHILQDCKQWLKDWHNLNNFFPENRYQDVEGLCKVVDRDEVEENDWSLTPGRYVGYSVQIDEDFDYKGRMREIYDQLSKLHQTADDLMTSIQGVKL